MSVLPVSVPVDTRELEDLLERRAVRGAERVRDETRGEAGPAGGTAPCGRVRALRRGEARGDVVECGPERRAAGREVPLAAVAEVELPAHRLPEQRAQVLVH